MPNILIKDGEEVMKKKVSFDESKNIITEFAKNEKIQPMSSTENLFNSPKRAANKKAAKSDKSKKEKTSGVESKTDSSEEDKSGGAAPASAPAAPAKNQMSADRVQSISNLATSDAVMKAKDDLLSKEPPNSFYQFERDFKGIKNDAQRSLKYLMNIKPQNYKNIFKSDLEAEIMLQIF